MKRMSFTSKGVPWVALLSSPSPNRRAVVTAAVQSGEHQLTSEDADLTP
jgi:hypothetical protein